MVLGTNFTEEFPNRVPDFGDGGAGLEFGDSGRPGESKTTDRQILISTATLAPPGSRGVSPGLGIRRR